MVGTIIQGKTLSGMAKAIPSMRVTDIGIVVPTVNQSMFIGGRFLVGLG
jgi:hypothetical protein